MLRSCSINAQLVYSQSSTQRASMLIHSIPCCTKTTGCNVNSQSSTHRASRLDSCSINSQSSTHRASRCSTHVTSMLNSSGCNIQLMYRQCSTHAVPAAEPACVQVLPGPELRGTQQHAEGQAEEVFTEGKACHMPTASTASATLVCQTHIHCSLTQCCNAALVHITLGMCTCSGLTCFTFSTSYFTDWCHGSLAHNRQGLSTNAGVQASARQANLRGT